MDSSQSANAPLNEKLAWIILLCVLGIWSCFSYTNWISDSEFWPITLAGHWVQWREHPALIYKAIFHATLSWIYLFDLDSVTHLKVAKAFYSFLGIVSFALFYRILRWKLDSLKSLIVTGAFLFSHIGFTQIGVIRSDFLDFLIFEIGLLFLLKTPASSWKRIGLINLIFAILILFSTPKGIYFVLFLAIFSLMWAEKKYRLKIFNLFLSFASLGLIIILSIESVRNALLSALRWNLGVREDFSYSLFTTTTPYYLTGDQFIGILLAFAWLFQTIQIFTKQRDKGDLPWSILSLCALIALIFHVPLLPFFLGSVWGLFYLGIIPILADIRTKYLFPVLLLVIVAFVTRFSEFHHYSNKRQYETLEKIDEIIKSVPNSKVFDGLGLLPRTPHVLTYIGPNDNVANTLAFAKLVQEKPEFVITTHRFNMIDSEVNTYLADHYSPFGVGYWVRKDIQIPMQVGRLNSAFFIFGFYPIPAMLKN